MGEPGQVGHAELAAQARRHTLRVEAQVARMNAAAPRFPRDPAADARCRQTFGMTGGECGCGELGCDTCAFSPAGPCACGEVCDHWPFQPNTRHLGARVKWKPPVVANPVGVGPGSGVIARGSGATNQTQAGPPAFNVGPSGMLSRDGGELPSDMVDFHTHIPAPSNQDWADTAGGRPDLTTQINALDAMDPASQFQAIGVSMNPIYHENFTPNDTYIQGTETLNEATAFCGDELSRILPFAQVPYYEIGSEDALDVVESMLANGFVGIGELLVHGHGLDETDYGWGGGSPVEALVPILELAAKYDVPVLLHWDLLTTDGDNPSPEESRKQFMELLDAVKDGVVVRGDPLMERRAVKVVLAHCGAGPEGIGANILDRSSVSGDAGRHETLDQS